MDFSILITNYGSDVSALVSELYRQAKKEYTRFEILISDDHPAPSDNLYEKLKNLSGVQVFTRPSPLGRSANRNFLIENARYQKLLLMDGDALVSNDDFLKNYIVKTAEKPIVCGGTAYQTTPPDSEKMLRWLYGVHREAIPARIRNENPWRSFSSFNLWADKKVFENLKFDETLTQYGHEDTLLGRMLKFECIPVHHIDNPALHNGLDTNREFLEKSKKAVENLALLIEKGWIDEDVKLYDALARVSKYGLRSILANLYKNRHQAWEDKLDKNPSLRLFDLYKLAYLCGLSRAEKARGL